MSSLGISQKISAKHVACFLPNLDGGGAERVMIHLSEGFAQRGWKVDLVVDRAAGAYTGKIPNTIRLIDLQARWRNPAQGQLPQIITKTWALRRYLREYQPDVLLTTLDIVNAGAWAKRLAGVSTKVIMVVQTHLAQQFSDRHSATVQKVRSQLVKQFYPWADSIVAASQGVANNVAAMMEISPDRIRVIYNPVVRPDLAAKAAEPLDHAWFAKAETVPVILGAGRLVKQKDFATLVRAFAQVRQQRPCRLVIIGDTDEREATVKSHLEQIIHDFNITTDVAFLGFVENPYKYMANAQVFVLSSIYEGFGNVVAEALSVGTSVVSTDCESGPAEILGQGQFGHLVPVKDSDALATAILKALDQPQPPDKLKARASDFTIETIVDQYCEVMAS